MIIAIANLANKKNSKATKWAFGMVLMVAIFLVLGSLIVMITPFPGSKII